MSWRDSEYSVSKTTPPSASSVVVPAWPKWRSASQSIRFESQMRAVPPGSPSCQSVRVAYTRGSKSSGRLKSCSAFDE